VIAATLPAGPQGARAARRLLTAALGQAGCAQELIDRVVLVGSELVTNAVLHGTGAPKLRLSVVPDGARLEIYDNAPGMPRQRERDDTMTSGRGMLIVRRSADRWGTEPEGPGKWVWAEFSAVERVDPPDAAHGAPAARHPVGVRLDALLRNQAAAVAGGRHPGRRLAGA
jgi:anti-sigma regulatory factor (Ser/Thr protein kinase)